MQPITSKKNFLGSVDFFEDLKKGFFLAKPHGIANPSLLRADIEEARRFANRINAPWTYISNTEDLKFPNPLNLLYLKEVKKLKHIKRIVVFAPNPIHNFMLRLTSFLIRPNKIISDRKEFEKIILSPN